MKIIHIIPNFFLAGAERMCEDLSIALKKEGHSVIAVSLYTEETPITDRLSQAGVRVVYLDKKRGLDLSMYGKLIRLFREEKPDVVHTHIIASKYGLPAAVIAGVPKIIHTAHSVAQKEQPKDGIIMNSLMFRRNGVVPVALSPAVQATIQEVYGLAKEEIPVIYNGIDLSRCIPKSAYSACGLFKILHIGRFMDVKNHDLLLHSFAELARKHGNVILQLIGEGPLLEQMKELSYELKIADQVEFLGPQPDVYTYLNRADVLVLPSKFEGVPMTLIEAMGTGLPIIASAVGGVLDMLTDDENALLIQPNTEELENAMERLYLDKNLREKLGNNALRRSADFSASEMARKYLDVYTKET